MGKWVKKKLGECLTIGNGQDYKHLNRGEIPVYGTGGVMTYVDSFLYDGETVCIGRKGTINKPIFHIGKIWTVDTLFYTHSFKDLLPLYAYYVFCAIKWDKYNEATGVPSLSKETINKIEVTIPSSLSEQRRIASILSSADKVIDSTQKLIAKYKQIKQGMMEDLLKPKEGWKMVKLGEVGEINPPNKESIPERFVYVDLESVVAGQLLFENIIVKKGAPSRAQRIIYENDVLYQTVRPYQKNNYIHKKAGNYVASTGYALIRCNVNYSSDFVYYVLHTYKFESNVLGLCTGTSYPAIAPNNLKKIEIFVPDLSEQRRIASILSGIDAKIEAEEKVLEKYKKIKKGLMERLLRGE